LLQLTIPSSLLLKNTFQVYRFNSVAVQALMLLLSSKRARFQPRTSLLSKRRENNQQRGKGEISTLPLSTNANRRWWKRRTENRSKNSVQVMKKESGKIYGNDGSKTLFKWWKKRNRKHENGSKNSVQVVKKKGEWKTWKRRQELCSSDENKGSENIENQSKILFKWWEKGNGKTWKRKQKLCSRDWKRGMENMKMESQLCSSASSCKLLGNLYGKKKIRAWN